MEIRLNGRAVVILILIFVVAFKLMSCIMNTDEEKKKKKLFSIRKSSLNRKSSNSESRFRFTKNPLTFKLSPLDLLKDLKIEKLKKAYKLLREAIKFKSRKKYRSAFIRIKHLLSISGRTGFENRYLRAQAYLILSDIYYEKKFLKESMKYYSKFINIMRKLGTDKRIKDMKRYYELRRDIVNIITKKTFQ